VAIAFSKTAKNVEEIRKPTNKTETKMARKPNFQLFHLRFKVKNSDPKIATLIELKKLLLP
jgi:hypothetical protein